MESEHPVDAADAGELAREVRIAEYWYRQGKDDGAKVECDKIIDWLRSVWRTDMGVIECLDIADAIERGEHLAEPE